MTPWYERYFTADYWSYADDEYRPERTAAEVDYLAGVLDRYAPGRRVLDLGCGVGRHAVGLAGRGFAVTGLDISGYALDRAASAAATAGVRLDLRRLDLLGEWDVPAVDAVVCVQAFGWGSDDDQLALLRRVRRALAPGGVLVLDHSNVLAIAARYAPESRADIGGASFHFVRRYDPVTGRSGGEVRVRRADGTAAVLPDDVRLYQPAEVAGLLDRAGFAVLRTDAEFTEGNPVTLASRYVQFTARPADPVASALAGHRGPADGLDLRWAPDEAELVAPAVARAWAEVAAGPDTIRRYDLADPWGGARTATALAAAVGWSAPDPARVSVGAGVTGLLHDLSRLADGGTVLLDRVGHPHLAEAATAGGDRARYAGFDSVADILAAVAAHRPAITVLDRPGLRGPTWTPVDVREIAGACRAAGGLLLVDETCGSYLPPGDSLVPLTDDVPGLVVLRGMSKGWCCGGLRIGFAVAAPGVASRVRAVLAPLAGAAVTIDVALALLRLPDPLAPLRARIAGAKPSAAALLADAGCPPLPTDPAVPWLVLPPEAGPLLAARGLTPKGVPVRDPEGHLLRVAVPLSGQRRAAFAEALRPVAVDR